MSSTKKEKKGTTRRGFFKEIGAGAAGVAVAGKLGDLQAAANPNPLAGTLATTPMSAPAVLPAKEELLTVLNPLGQPPPLALLPLAPRLSNLRDKTIYVVDTKFPSTKPFFEELVNALKGKYPEANWVPRDKIGSYFDDDPKLWAEIKEKGHGMVILVGH